MCKILEGLDTKSVLLAVRDVAGVVIAHPELLLRSDFADMLLLAHFLRRR